jgi:SAM-dependent methyltransferase
MSHPDANVTSTATTLACPLCGTAGGGGIELRARDYEYRVPGEWAIARCRHCRFHFQAPLPDATEIPGFYPSTYTAFSENPATGLMFRLHYWLDARRVARLIGRRGRILDVGCGDGSALLALRRRGPWELFGLELDEGAAQKARAAGLEVQGGDLASCTLPTGTFDLIRMGHVIEHVLDPLRTLERARDLLRSGGVLFGETPNTACLDFRLLGRYWGALHVPRHITFFDHGTLRDALARTGFKDIEIHPRLRTVGWSAGIQNLLADRFGLAVPDHGRVAWYPLLIGLCLPLTVTQALLAWPATVAFVARKP